jgi:hypothetical protein
MSAALWVLLSLMALALIVTTARVSYGLGYADGKRAVYDEMRMSSTRVGMDASQDPKVAVGDHVTFDDSAGVVAKLGGNVLTVQGSGGTWGVHVSQVVRTASRGKVASHEG